MHDARVDNALLLLLETFLLAAFCWCFGCFRHTPLCLTRSLLLVRHRAAARALAGSRVGVRPLSAHRQAAAMPQSAVRSHLDVPLDIHRDFLAEIAFDRAFFFQNLADLVDLVFGEVANLLIEIDAGPMEERLRSRTADTINIRQPD